MGQTKWLNRRGSAWTWMWMGICWNSNWSTGTRENLTGKDSSQIGLFNVQRQTALCIQMLMNFVSQWRWYVVVVLTIQLDKVKLPDASWINSAAYLWMMNPSAGDPANIYRVNTLAGNNGECNHAMRPWIPANFIGGPYLSGCSNAQVIGYWFSQSIPNPPKVIFTTAYRDYAVEVLNWASWTFCLSLIPLTGFFGRTQGSRFGTPYATRC